RANGGFFYSHWVFGVSINGGVFELYNNTFTGNASTWNNYPGRIEAGTGVIYNNTITSYTGKTVVFDERRGNGNGESSGAFGACDGTKAWDGNAGDPAAPGWPCLGQIGRSPGKTMAQIISGDKQTSAPFYLWNNGTQSGCATGGSCTDGSTV